MANIQNSTAKRRSKAASVMMVTFFVLVAFCTLLPLYCILLASLKPSQELLRYGLNCRFDYELFSLKNFLGLFDPKASNYMIWYQNSLVNTAVQTGCTLVVSSLVGYGIAMYDFRGRNAIFLCVLLVMMIPVEVIMLPLYREMITLRLIDTIWGLILPLIAMPLPIFFFRQYASGIPKDFQDAARIDGCGEFGIFLRIFAPLMRPAYAAMGIFVGMASWNNFLWPLVILRSPKKLTLPIGLASLLSPYGNNYDILIAGSVMAILPIILLYFALQKYFIAGMTAGGVKG